ncbi:MAG: hypothetical protein ABJF88_09545 [Rhodothermales bacterium]
MLRWIPTFTGLVLTGVNLLLGGCGREPERPDAPPDSTAMAGVIMPDSADAPPAPPINPFAEPARRALRIELGLDDYRTVDGTWAGGDASSTFTAYFAGDTLRFIEERLSAGAYGSESNVYYFADGVPFYAVQDAVQVRPGLDGAARRDTVRLRVALTPEGDLLAAEGTVNGERESVDRVLADGVRQHAEALRARAAAGARPAL